VSFAARLQLHWADLEKREPSVKIVCPITATPHNSGCISILAERRKHTAATNPPRDA
jgi:hypothetical protein